MSNAIRDTERLNQRQLESLKKRNEREIRNLENSHQNYKAELKKAHSGEIVEIQDQNQRQINVEAEKKEKILSELKNHLDQTGQLTEKELKALKQNSEKEKAQTQQKLSLDRERIVGEHELFLDDLNDRYNSVVKKANQDGKQRVEDIDNDFQKTYSDKGAFNQQKLSSQSEEFTTRFSHDERNNKILKDNQDKQFKNERLTTNTRQQIEIGKLTEVHNTELQKRDEVLRKGLKEQDQFFEDKYKKNLDTHNAHFKSLDEQHQKVISAMKGNLTKEITQTANRRDDSFYQFESLKPRMTKFEDRVEISVEVPEHSKADLQLTTNLKEAVLSFNRRYVDANKTQDGVINKINKVESFTTRLNTEMTLNPKNIKSNYDNGTMTYVIMKA